MPETTIDAQLYSPVARDESGAVDVKLGADHPGFHDPEYRARRSAIAELSVDWSPGDPVPGVDYTAVEHGVWRIVSAELAPLHQEFCLLYTSDAADE